MRNKYSKECPHIIELKSKSIRLSQSADQPKVTINPWAAIQKKFRNIIKANFRRRARKSEYNNQTNVEEGLEPQLEARTARATATIAAKREEVKIAEVDWTSQVTSLSRQLLVAKRPLLCLQNLF